MPLIRPFPAGFFWDDMLWWGDNLGPTTSFAKGAKLEVPDLRNADAHTLINLRFQNLQLLANIGEANAMQFHWEVSDNYYADLDRYDAHTAKRKAEGRLTRWSEDRRKIRSDYCRDQLAKGQRRREQVHVYVAQRCRDLKGGELRSKVLADGYLKSQAASLENKFAQMQMNYPLGRWTPLDDLGHCRHLRHVLNPAIARELAMSPALAVAGFDASNSIRKNCLSSDVAPFSFGRGEDAGKGLAFDGYLHAFFVIRRNPSRTRPGILLPLFGAVDKNCSVVQNIYPLPVNPEVERLRKEIDELMKFLNDPKSLGVDQDILNRKARINSLLSSVVVPFKVLTVIRVWAETVEALNGVTLGVKSALNRMDGLAYHLVNDEVRARNLFLETIPGNMGSDYRGWDIYTENLNLADLLPVSSTFTGHLEDAQILLESPGGGIVGVRALAGGTPQHTTLTGVNGAGKTAMMIEMLSQLESDVDYLYLQEEGVALATYAKVRGLPSLILRDSSSYTLNPFDTFGLPLTSGSIATVVNVAMKLVGQSADGDKNKCRANLIGEYVGLLYSETAEDIKDSDEERWFRLSGRAVLAEKLRRGPDDFLDGFVALRNLERTEPERFKEMLSALREEEIIKYATGPIGPGNIRSLVFTELKPDEYPQWNALCSILMAGRRANHKTGAIADELNYLASDLSQGKRFGGRLGPLIDGETNIDLHGPGLHIDTSYLSDGVLKETAGYLFPEMVRKHIMGLPRAQFKVMMLDELRRLLLIPGATEFVKEMLAQLRKYKCWFIGAFQSPSQIDEIDPALSALLMGQCKQHFLMRQNETGEIAKIAKSIGLPASAQREIFRHPLIEHQTGARKASYFTLFSRDGTAPVSGTVRVEVDPYTLYVASSNGDVFDQKMSALGKYKDATEGVYAEVGQQLKKKAAAA